MNSLSCIDVMFFRPCLADSSGYHANPVIGALFALRGIKVTLKRLELDFYG